MNGPCGRCGERVAGVQCPKSIHPVTCGKLLCYRLLPHPHYPTPITKGKCLLCGANIAEGMFCAECVRGEEAKAAVATTPPYAPKFPELIRHGGSKNGGKYPLRCRRVKTRDSGKLCYYCGGEIEVGVVNYMFRSKGSNAYSHVECAEGREDRQIIIVG